MAVSKQKLSEKMGRAFERRLAGLLSDAKVLVKVPTARTTTGRHTGRIWLDYVACLPGGQMLTFDAKFIGAKSRVTKSVLSKHQREWCEAAHEMGAVVCVLVGRIGGGQVWVHAVDWGTLRGGGVDLDEGGAIEDWGGLVDWSDQFRKINALRIDSGGL